VSAPSGRGRGRSRRSKGGGSASRLPAGRHGLSREFVAANQRERIVTALADCIAERGFAATTVTQIAKAAGVSRATFYQHFDGKEACFLATYEMVADHLWSLVEEAARPEAQWPERLRAGLAALLGFLAAEPELARLVLIEPVAVGGAAAERQRASLRGIGERLRVGREAASKPELLPDGIEEALVGGIVALVVREVGAGRAERLPRLLPELLALTLIPYVGPEEAQRLVSETSASDQ
jgi:AcrR family transcriptional regulator